MRHIIVCIIILGILIGTSWGQPETVDIPDSNLRSALREVFGLPPGAPISHNLLSQVPTLILDGRGIENIEGLQFAVHLTELNLAGNPITDISPLSTLVNLESLDLVWCRVVADISPLATLKQLRHVNLSHNQIRDISPLADLHNLEILHISHNYIVDYSPVDNLQLREFIYDQECDMPGLSSIPRIENRQFPSIFGAFVDTTLNQPHLPRLENIAQHDMVFSASHFGLNLFDNGAFWEVRGHINNSIAERDTLLSYNPHMIFLSELRLHDAGCKDYPESWPYWKRDEHGNIVRGGRWCGIDFTNPGFQDLLVSQAIAVSKCGLYDGIFLDWWNELGPPDELQARETIIRRIRANTRSDFLILANTNDRTIPKTASFINGAFMESLFPLDLTHQELEERLVEVEYLLPWMESHLRPPVFTAPSGGTYTAEPPHSHYNLRWMRLVTTLSLTHSDGYVLFNIGSKDSIHLWYDFWDADLGRPVGEKRQPYQGIDGLYIREFTNGWAVYNHSGEAQVIALPEEAQGVASGRVGAEHTLPNLDGEMYLRMRPENPADVNGDGVVNILDLVLVAQAFGKDGLQGDVNGDGVVNVFDLVQVAGAIGGGAAPPAHSPDLSIISAADVERWLAGAQGLGVGDANFQQGIRFLEGLLSALTPKETTLLPNYPNPFNPETWIPYRLAREAEVAITIYDTKGTLVRRLALGNQAAGYYAERGKAAYWDGRNEDGEAVASGIYIYQFRAGNYAASRRMVIVK